MIVNGLKGDLSSSCLCWWWLNSCFEVRNLVCGPGLYFEDKHCNPTVNNMKYFPVILWVREAGWPCLRKECLWSSYFFSLSVWTVPNTTWKITTVISWAWGCKFKSVSFLIIVFAIFQLECFWRRAMDTYACPKTNS